MAIEAAHSNSRSFPGPEAIEQAQMVDFMTPDDFTRLTKRFVASVRIIHVPERNRNQGYKADLLRVNDKKIMTDGISQTIPQFEVQLGSYLTLEERGVELVRKLSDIRENEQIRISGPKITTLAEMELEETAKEIGAQAFYQAQRKLVDGYIRETVMRPRII